MQRFKLWIGLISCALMLIFWSAPGQGQGKEEKPGTRGTTFKGLAGEAKQKAQKDMKEVKKGIKEAGKELKESAVDLKNKAGKEAKKAGEELKKTGKGIKESIKEAFRERGMAEQNAPDG